MEDSRLALRRASPGLDPMRGPFMDPTMMAKYYTTRFARGCGARKMESFKIKPRPWKPHEYHETQRGGSRIKT